MLDGKTVAVVVPANNEEALVGSTVAGIPSFVDRIIVVDDASRDTTADRARTGDERVEVVAHERNQGVGAAILTGYKQAVAEDVDVTCVMAADGQMARMTWRHSSAPLHPGTWIMRKRPALHRPGVGAHTVDALPGERGALVHDENCLRLLARRRLAVGLHGGQPRDAVTPRPRPDLQALRLPQRHARASERLQPPCTRLSFAADLRRRRAERHPALEGGA